MITELSASTAVIYKCLRKNEQAVGMNPVELERGETGLTVNSRDTI